MTEQKRSPGRPKGSGDQKSGSTRAKESRAAKLEAGGERYEVIINAGAKTNKEYILTHRDELESKTELLETLLKEEAVRLKRKHSR